MAEEGAIDKKNALWRFSLNYYSTPDVPDICLFLQDNYNVDVNILLLILWLAASGKSLSVDEIAEIDRHVKHWRDTVIVPLRMIRRSIPKPEEASSRLAFRANLKKLELESERIEQDDLFSQFRTHTGVAPDPVAARKGLDAYASYLGSSFQHDAVARLLSIYEAFRTI
ncbi:MAG: TIGR02444 family protein [Xanthobacteraceae bacterium]|nr:TIGR02444 family protein [Xanthobacteraceae bacterium]MCW5675391.1 TIGR02444 family protein [Xanthobacteraceae bacterium]